MFAAVPQDRVDDRGLRDPGDDLHLDAAARTHGADRPRTPCEACAPRPDGEVPAAEPGGAGVGGSSNETSRGRSSWASGGGLGSRRTAVRQHGAGLGEAAPRAVRVGAVVTNHVRAGVRDLLAEGVDEVEAVHHQHRLARPRIGRRLDPDAAAVQELHGPHRQHHARGVARQAFEPAALVGGEALRRLDREARVAPGEEALAGLGPQAPGALQEKQEAAAIEATSVEEACRRMGEQHGLDAEAMRWSPDSGRASRDGRSRHARSARVRWRVGFGDRPAAGQLGGLRLLQHDHGGDGEGYRLITRSPIWMSIFCKLLIERPVDTFACTSAISTIATYWLPRDTV